MCFWMKCESQIVTSCDRIADIDLCVRACVCVYLCTLVIALIDSQILMHLNLNVLIGVAAAVILSQDGPRLIHFLVSCLMPINQHTENCFSLSAYTNYSH